MGLALIVLTFSSCKKFSGDVTIPAFVHLDYIDIVPQSEEAPSTEPGFYSSLIDAVQFTGYFEGDTAEINFGTFQLPCQVPVLRHGTMKYLVVTPVLKQDGASGTRIEYPFFMPKKLENIRLAPDSTTNLGTYNPSTNKWSIETYYRTRKQMTVLMEEYFEPTSFSIGFDSTMIWERDAMGLACTGQGYGRVHIDSGVSNVPFMVKSGLSAPKGSMLYLEMDYWTDVDLAVNMTAELVSGSTQGTVGVITLYANAHWQKIYINLGRSWRQLNYNSPFFVSFQALNLDGKEHDVRIDNVKILAR